MKPKLVFLPGNATLEDVLVFYETLTGREATPEERAATEALYAEYKQGVPKPKPKP